MEQRGTRRLTLLLWLLAGMLAFDLCVMTGLIGGWGEWYSPFLPYRFQTDAFLDGDVALSTSPSAMEHDLAWGRGGVQQVWGLGVPCWRLPFEAIARACGQPAFPDRLALMAAVAIAGYLVLCGVTGSSGFSSIQSWFESLCINPARAAAAVCLILFPPIITLCSGPLNVYEEAVAYGYFYSIGLFGGTLIFLRRPNVRAYVALSLFAGLAGFVRPTMMAYGLSTLTVLFFKSRQNTGWSVRRLLVGPVVFAIGVGLLCWSNAHRFGSPFEFGHSTTISAVDVMYFTRFGSPFADESLPSAAAELLGSIFFVKELSGFDVYEKGIVAFQSPTLRWRHFYGSTFDATFLVVSIGCSLLALWAWRSSQRGERSGELRAIALWSTISMALLAAFYLRFAFMSSRYVLDFAPGMAAAVVGILVASDFLLRKPSRWTNVAMLVGIAIWWGYECYSAKQSFSSSPVLSRQDAIKATRALLPLDLVIPSSYDAADAEIDRLNIHGNCRGWHRPDGSTESMVVLFINDPTILALDVEAARGETLTDADCRVIQARIGPKRLTLHAIESTPNGKRLIFDPPPDEASRKGIQMTCIAFAPADDAAVEKSHFLLRHVGWRLNPR